MSDFRFHPDAVDAFDPRIVPKRVVNLDAAREQYGDAVDRYTPFFMQGDPLADELVNELQLYQQEPGEGHRLFDQALADGIDSIQQPPPVLAQFFRSVERIPPWVDWEQLALGGQVLIRSGGLSFMALAFSGLVYSYGSPAGNKPLMHTEQLVKLASKRLSETGRFMLQVCLPRGLLRGSEGYELSIRTRVLHANVRRMLLRSDWWDLDSWGMPINQLDMAGTNTQFSLSLMHSMRKLGVVISKEEEDAVLSLWRYAGLLMGVNRELIVSNTYEGNRLNDIIMSINGLPDEDSHELIDALLSVSKEVFSSKHKILDRVTRGQFLASLFRHLVGNPMAGRIGLTPNKSDVIIPLFRALNFSQSMLKRLLPHRKESQFAFGRAEWEEVINELAQSNDC